MTMRRGLVGLAGVLAAAGAGAAKPPGLPAGPLVEGREPTPVVRDYYEEDARRPEGGAGLVPAWVGRGERAESPLAGIVTGLRGAVLNRLTVPLGLVPVRE